MGSWGSTTARPASNWWGATAIVGDTIWNIGGGTTTDWRTFDTLTATWTTKSSTFSVASGSAAAVVNDTIYVIIASDTNMKKVNGTTGALISTIPLGLSVTTPTMTSFGDYIYINNGGSNYIHRYDTTNDTINTTWALPSFIGRRGLIVDPDGEYLYLFGGYTGSTSVERILLSTGVVSARTGIPAGRWGGVVGARSGLLFYLGGHNGNTTTGVNTNYAFDPATNTWSTKTAGPNNVGRAFGGTAGSRIYVQGGVHASALTINIYWEEPQRSMGTAEAVGEAFTSAAALFPEAEAEGEAETDVVMDVEFSGRGVDSSSLLVINEAG